MSSAFEMVRSLTDRNTSPTAKRELATQFSRAFGWRPNDFIDAESSFTTASLVVEHGLDNAAVLSFMPAGIRLPDLQVDERRSILGLSYNSLVDWHVWIDRESIGYVYNRTNPPSLVDTHGFDHTDYSALTKSTFDQAVGRAPNPNIPALDGILLETIGNWRRILRSELGEGATNESMSALFNALIFARAIEDFHTKLPGQHRYASLLDQVGARNGNITDAIVNTIVERTGLPVSEGLLDHSALQPFARLSEGLRTELVSAFYGHPSVPYAYDFSVMSKHALSKIYEKYVSVMQRDEPIQFSMFPKEPEEDWNKKLGGIYTPHYIASFFARYLRSQLSNERFIRSSVMDPACGSGIFLRATMEQKILAGGGTLSRSDDDALEALMGVDIDENAVAASRLSLALLHLAVTGELPSAVPVRHGDSLDIFSPGSRHSRRFDAVMMNPPFIRTEHQTEAVREAIVKHIGFAAKGKLDTYLAFIALSVQALRPGGFGFFVVPQPLLTSDNLSKLRDWIREQAWVRVIADLSAIRVFRANVYVALLVVQRKDRLALDEPPVSLIHCQRDVGLALEEFLDGKRRETSSYSMFDAPQASLERPTWSVTAPEEADLLSKLDTMGRIKDVASVRQGMITGADSVFVMDSDKVPFGEEVLYKPLLPDRMIGRFSLPTETGRKVFYPYVGDVAVTADQLESEFPATWERLSHHKRDLSKRASVKSGSCQWWRPGSPRQPHEMLVPKIVVPEVFLVPRFGCDTRGQWVVSHSPFIHLPKENSDDALLLVLTALLNSSVSAWFIDSNARKYRNQYNKLSVSLLSRVPIPNLNEVPLAIRRRAIALTRELVGNGNGLDIELAIELDHIILREFYGLSDDEVSLVAP